MLRQKFCKKIPLVKGPFHVFHPWKSMCHQILLFARWTSICSPSLHDKLLSVNGKLLEVQIETLCRFEAQHLKK